MRRFVLAAATLTTSLVLAGPAAAAGTPGSFTLAPAAMQPVLIGTISAEPSPSKGEQPVVTVKRASSVDIL
jgi:hypothetical protein